MKESLQWINNPGQATLLAQTDSINDTFIIEKKSHIV
jgi:hypothetical protein